MILHSANIFVNLIKLILRVKDVREEKEKTIFFQNKTYIFI